MDDMQKIFDYASWFFLMLFAVPTVLIMASWSSLPGEPMFAVKRSFEQALLFAVKPSYNTEAKLNIQYTQRRLSETKVLLAKNKSGEGISYLRQQISATKVLIEKAPDQATKKKLAATYVSMLREVSSDLSQQRQQIAYTQPKNENIPSQFVQAQQQPPSNNQQQGGFAVQTPTRIPTIYYPQGNTTTGGNSIDVVVTQIPTPTNAPVTSEGESNQNDSTQIDQSNTTTTTDSIQADSMADTANELDDAVVETNEAIDSMVAISNEPVKTESNQGNDDEGENGNNGGNNGNNGGNSGNNGGN